MVPVHGKGGWRRIALAVKIVITQWPSRVFGFIRSVFHIYHDTQVLSPERLTVPVVSDHYLYYAPTDHPFRAHRRPHMMRDD